MSRSKSSPSTAIAVAVWLLASCFVFYKYMLEMSPNVMSQEFMHGLGLNALEYGNFAACYYYAYSLMQIPIGTMLDRFGPRYLMMTAVALAGLGTGLVAMSHGYTLACVGRFVTGIGAAAAFISCFKIISLYFRAERFALIAGLTMTLGMFGAVFGQAPLRLFLDHVGWRPGFYWLMGAGLLLSLLYALLIHPPKSPRQDAAMKKEGAALWQSLFAVMATRKTWLVSLYSGLCFAPVTILGGLWGGPFLHIAYGLTMANAGFSISLLFIGIAIGAPLWGWVSDRLGRRLPVMVLGTSLALVLVIVLIYLPGLTLWVIDGLTFGFGLSLSAFFLSFTLVKEYNLFVYTATAVGFMNAFNALLNAVSDPLTGKILDLTAQGHGAHAIYSLGGYQQALLTIPAYLVIALIILRFIPETYCKGVEEAK